MTEAIQTIHLHNRSGEIIAHAIVDSEDAPFVSQYRWYRSTRGRSTRVYYAQRWTRDAGVVRAVYMHRQIMDLPVEADERHVDHRNGDGLDNRRANLRVVTRAQNAQNVVARIGTSSRYRGVSWDHERRAWRARVTVGGRVYRLGRWQSEDEAAHATASFRLAHMPYTEERQGQQGAAPSE